MSNHIRRLALSCLVVVLGSIIPASAQRFVPLHTFSTATHFFAPLAQAPDGTLYGVSSTGGLSNDGTVFKLQPDGTRFAILYSFTNGIDGSGPIAGLVVSGNALYGTAKSGGSGGHGTIFKLNTDGSGFTPIYSFSPYATSTNADGASPAAALVLSDGVLYGTASQGGLGYGTVFKVNTDGNGFSTLYTFSGVVRSGDGSYPMASLVLSDDTLYGTTQEGGTNGYGTVFKIDTDGMNFATLHAFSNTSTGADANGDFPVANLVLSGDTLYGTASGGGLDHGTIFKVNIDGNGFAKLYTFTNGVDGSAPRAGLVVTNNTLYGTTSSGGVFPGWGTVFKLGTDGNGFTNLYDFPGNGGAVEPNAGLVLSGNTLIGTTLNFGAGGGSIFAVNTDGTGFATLSYGNDGSAPEGGLVLAGGTAYGTTSAGGSYGSGTIFEVNTNGTGFAAIHEFSALAYNAGSAEQTNPDGSAPEGTLVLGDGTLYGTANTGGEYGFGSIYRLKTNGTAFTNLYSFTNASGYPSEGLLLAGNALFGTTGTTIFTINTDGTDFTILHTFSSFGGTTNSDGYGPLSSLTLSGSTLYGAAESEGPLGGGTIFKIETNGTGFSNIYSLTAVTRSTGTNVNNSQGASPLGGLILSGDTLFGAATAGGGEGGVGRGGLGSGSLFELDISGTDFAPVFIFPKSAFDGGAPNTRLVLSGDILYGTTSASDGTVFELNTDGTSFATLHAFPFQGGTPMGDLILAGGSLYGTSKFSVPGSGTVFSLTPTATPTIEFTASPASGSPPLIVTLNAPPVDSEGNTILYYRMDYGDGTTGTGAFPATHTYATNGIYTPTLVVTNVNGAIFTGTGPSIVVAFPTSIQNNGFEAGTFTNWTLSGSGQIISTATNYVHSGAYGAELGAVSSLSYLSQTITTTPGTDYTVSFWLDSFVTHPPNEFQVLWDGAILFDKTNIGAIGWTNIQLNVTATTVNTVLKFGYRNNASHFGMDDVSVTSGTVTSSQPTIASASVSGGNLVLNCGGGSPTQTYYLFMGTNLLEPISEWTPVATNAPGATGNFSFTATNAVDPKALQRYFIIEAQ